MSEIPFSEDDEKGVLSCMMQSVVVLRAASVDLNADVFFAEKSQVLFSAFLELDRLGKPVDLITVSGFLRDKNIVDRVGSLADVAAILNFAPAPAHYAFYRDEIRRKFALRQLRHVGALVQRLASEGADDPKTILETADRELTAIHQSLGNSRVQATRHIRAILADCAEEVEGWQSGELSPGISTGLDPFDRKQLLLRKHGYFVVAAPTNTGKSTMLSQMALAATAQGKRVAIASVEDPSMTFGHRMTAYQSRVSFSRMTQAQKLSRYDYQKYQRAVGELVQRELVIMHNGAMTCDEFRHWARRQVMDFGAEVIALDYLQKLRPCTKRGQNTYTDAVVEATDTVKELSNNLPACFLVAVQTNQMRGRKATKDDLKQSSQISQDATELLILQRKSDIEARDDDDEPEARPDVSVAVEILATIAKQKNGGHAEIPLYLFGDIFRFEQPARESQP